MDKVTLLPCPFCGSTAPEMLGHDSVWCGSCLATMPEHDPDVPNARARWNTRASTAPDSEKLREALEKQIEGQDEMLPNSIARERGLVWLEGWFDLPAALGASA
jgi:hypothetical protein